MLSKSTKANKLNQTLEESKIDIYNLEDIKTRQYFRSTKLSPIEIFEHMKKLDVKNRYNTKSVTFDVKLNLDPKRGDHIVRGIYKMPGGSTFIPKLIVFTSPQYEDIARNAGADIIADAQTFEDIQNGEVNFDKCVCTLDVLTKVKTLGKTLGPLGLMPNTKVGTASTIDNLENIIKDLKTGNKEYKNTPTGNIITNIGRLNFEKNNLLLNLNSFIKNIHSKKPESIKDAYIKNAKINFTFGKICYNVDVKTIDVDSVYYFGNEL